MRVFHVIFYLCSLHSCCAVSSVQSYGSSRLDSTSSDSGSSTDSSDESVNIG